MQRERAGSGGKLDHIYIIFSTWNHAPSSALTSFSLAVTQSTTTPWSMRQAADGHLDFASETAENWMAARSKYVIHPSR
jgi:hypothetical protein